MMKIAVAFRLALGATCMLTAQQGHAQTTNVPAARTTTYPGIGVRDEEFIGESQGTLYFVSPNQTKSGANPEAWLHVEEPEDRGAPGRPMRSALVLFEFDCSGKAMRQTMMIVAAASDLQEPYPPMNQPPGPWRPVGSEAYFKAFPKVCGSPAANK